jgi:hypothetical protein
MRKFCFKFRNREVVNAFRRMKEEVQVFLSIDTYIHTYIYSKAHEGGGAGLLLSLSLSLRRRCSVSWLH